MADNELGLFREYGEFILYASLILYELFIHYLQQTYGYPCE
jgi:hypothetical protein